MHLSAALTFAGDPSPTRALIERHFVESLLIEIITTRNQVTVEASWKRQ